MKRVVWKYGLIAGAILAVMLVITMPLYSSGKIEIEGSEIYGYSGMILAFLMVFFGIRAYREENPGQDLSFRTALKVGLLITLVASLVYVITWEILYKSLE